MLPNICLVAGGQSVLTIAVFRLDETEENDFNLNIPRYVDTFEEEEEIDIAEVQREIEGLEAELVQVREKMAGYLEELGV